METETESPVERAKKENFFALHSTMAELNSKNEFCDVTIQVENQFLKSHRFILAALSEYFYAMFSGNFKERLVKDEPIVLHNMNADAFKLILDFMYSGDVNITKFNVFSLLITADFLKLRHAYIETECTKFIHEHIWVPGLIPNMMKIFEFSRVTKKTALTNITRKYICQHMGQLFENDVFEKISCEDMKIILQPECPFWIYNQDIVLNFLIQWVHQSHKERKSHFKELMKLIDLKKVSNQCTSFLLGEYEELIGRFEDAEGAGNMGSKLFTSPFIMDCAQPEATITLVVDDFSNLIKTKGFILVESFPCMIQNLPWRLSLQIEDDKRSVGLYLKCDGHPMIETWSCRASYEFSILPNFSKKSKTGGNIHKEEKKTWGYKSLVSLDDLMNPIRGLVKNDVVVFQAHVIADLPNLGTEH